jgi:membrane protease YdiL (CAAX protease family)
MNDDHDIQPVADPPTTTVVRDDEMPPVRFGLIAGIGVTLCAMLGALAASKVLHIRQNSPYYELMLGLSLLVLMLLPTLYLARTQSLPSRDLFRLRPTSPLVFVATLIGVISLSTILQAYTIAQEVYLVPPGLKKVYMELSNKTQEAIISLVHTGDMWGLILALLSVAVMPAISEEFLFRGLVQRSFERRMRPLAAIALAGIMFGSVHLQVINAVALMALGTFFGYVTWSSGSIYPAIFGHFIFNALTIVALFFTGEGAIDIVSRHTPDDILELLPIAIPSMFVFIAVILWLRGQRHERQAAGPS